MTPEEEVVIQEALAWRESLLAHPMDPTNPDYARALETLARATYQLAMARTPKSSDTHPLSWIPFTWVLRTWRDVRQGDHIRMPGTDDAAYVHSAVHLPFHVDPTSSQYRPVPLEWAGVRVRLSGERTGQDTDQDVTSYLMDPDKPIEIELAPAELAAIALMGWDNRVGMIVE